MVDDLLRILSQPDLLAGGSGPLYQRLASAVHAALHQAQIAPGMLLPPERTLAEAVGVSRSTVVAAYDHLRDSGVVERRQGSGTRVSPGAVAQVSVAREAQLIEALHRNTLFRGVTEGTQGGIDFLGNCLTAPECFPDLLASAQHELLGSFGHHGYYPQGYPPLQQAIADYLSAKGVPTTARQVLVTNGAQQALSLAMAFFVQRGEPVAMENPTYPGAIDAATAVGAQLLSIPVDPDGARISALADLLASRSPKLVYLNPTFQNPTGTVMGREARAEVARLAARHQVVVIEDCAEADLTIGPEPPLPIASHDPDAPILSVGSMSKLFWGGLRVGWIRAPGPLISRLTSFKAVLDLGTSLPSQVLARLLLARFDEVKAQRRREAVERFALLQRMLADLLPSWSWAQPRGGLALWIRLPSGSARDLAAEARRHGVAILPGPTTSLDLSFDSHLRLTIARPPEVLTAGIERLASAWQEYTSRAEDPDRRFEVIV